MSSRRPLAVVTGASKGIGYELAKQFASNGFDLVVCADHEDIHTAAMEFAQLTHRVHAVQVDLAEYDGVETLYDSAQKLGPIDALAVNAGFGVAGDFARETDLRDELRMIQLNVVSTVHLTKRIVKDMVARGKGRILITASIAGAMPTPLEAVYGATKAFDLSFAASLRHELRDTGVSVTAMVPGPTDTNFAHRAGLDDTKVAEESKKNHPADVAKQGFEALMDGRDRVHAATSLGTKLQAAAQRFVPDALKAEWHRKMSEPGSARK
ncbi:SDR family NAD(P)-dependent oxidoreductase [Pendulispora rubella]|uniref:SDR family NAD(P)-dependent oxidoreductase n=1 Tax=Pendulispora rubella TaxID=2741070 RepID=A0ABZ2LCE2_9BACT